MRTFINAAGTFTTLTASLMPPEVIEAIEYASKHFVSLTKLQDAVGEKIASMLGCEAAMVTTGAAGAMTVGTAGCITGTDQEAIRRLPDLTGLKNEVIIQKSHRFGYDHAVRACGVRLVEVETREELEAAVSPQTAMMLFYNNNDPVGKIRAEEFVALGKKHGVPTFNDASADTPPVGNLTRYIKMGFDLVTFSGGKGICGPQSAGLLLGRKDLIAAARLNTSPYSDTISRGMKVNKEEMLAMLVALELFLKRDHDAVWREWERRVKLIGDAARSVKTVQTETFVPEIANHVPHLKLRWDEEVVRISPPEVLRRMRDGEPSIELNPGTNKTELVVGVWMLQPGEAEIVARRLREVLRSAA
ncbi:MAG: aminotransferase class V-fold PLP-dependent enzyme [Bryobacteraceae bacterium]